MISDQIFLLYHKIPPEDEEVDRFYSILYYVKNVTQSNS